MQFSLEIFFVPLDMFESDQLDPIIRRRREWTFLVLVGIFLGSLTMLNILGVSRFIDLSSWFGISDDSDFRFAIAVGVLPYPITFLCTDLISELYGRKRANMVVWIGFILNLWVLLVLWFGGWLEAPADLVDGRLVPQVVDGEAQVPYGYAFYEMRTLAFGATIASMVAYLVAQFVDVQVFHYLKKKTGGKKLWLRNNVSTLTSQLIDSVVVILVTHYYANALPLQEDVSVSYQLLMFILSAYALKVIFALLDTIPIYFAVKKLRSFLRIDDEIPF
ncbi:MAG: queuosine precursor transporter [Crocinitomicaceae bacterium]